MPNQGNFWVIFLFHTMAVKCIQMYFIPFYIEQKMEFFILYSLLTYGYGIAVSTARNHKNLQNKKKTII